MRPHSPKTLDKPWKLSSVHRAQAGLTQMGMKVDVKDALPDIENALHGISNRNAADPCSGLWVIEVLVIGNGLVIGHDHQQGVAVTIADLGCGESYAFVGESM